jgi:hypothetical protein
MRSLKTNRVVAGAVLALIAVAVVMVQTSGDSALAQQVGPATTPAQPPATAASPVLLDPNDTVFLLLDHQTGLFQTA